MHPLRFGPLTLRSRYLLAPLASYTNLSFRMAVRELGGLGLATTDLVNARALLLFSRKTMDLLQTCPEDRPVVVRDLRQRRRRHEERRPPARRLRRLVERYKLGRNGGVRVFTSLVNPRHPLFQLRARQAFRFPVE